MTRREEGVGPVPSFPSRTTNRGPSRSPCLDTNPPNPPNPRPREGSKPIPPGSWKEPHPAEKTSRRRGSTRRCVGRNPPATSLPGVFLPPGTRGRPATRRFPGGSEHPLNPAHDLSIGTSLPLFPALPIFQQLATVSPGYVGHRFLLHSYSISMPRRNAFFLGGHARKVIERWRLVKKRG